MGSRYSVPSGVLVPVIVTALELKSLETWAKTALIACFGLGLLAVLGYVLWFWSRIKRE